jgi:hypothetical protein
MTKMKAQCPNCKSDNMELRSRTKFFINALICFTVVAAFCYVFNDIKNMDFEPPAALILPFIFLGFLFAISRGLYWSVRALLLKGSDFKCLNCKFTCKTPLFIQSVTTNEKQLNTIKKRKFRSN